MKVKQAEREAPIEAEIEQEPYEETPHKQKMREPLSNDEISVLRQYRLKLATGLSEYEPPVPIRPLFQELCIKGIIRLEQRLMSSGPHQFDRGFWVYTDRGKDVAQRLDINESE